MGLFATKDIKANTFIGVTHIRDEQFENKYIRTPLGGFYNHSNDPTVMRMVSNMLPTLKFGDPIDTKAKAKRFDENDTNRENMYYNLSEKPDAKYMFMVSVKDIKSGQVEIKNDKDGNVGLSLSLIHISEPTRPY